MIFGLLAIVALVGVFTFYNHHLFDWIGQQRRQSKSVHSHAQRLIDRSRGVEGAVNELTQRLAATDLSANGRKHLESVLRRVQKGDLEPRAGEIKISRPSEPISDQA